MEAIILAGGKGTRLKSVIKNIPKPMALVDNMPFLEHIFKYLQKNRVQKVVLSVGYKYKFIKEYFGDKWEDIEIVYSIEDTPLGTGGAIKKALSYIKNKEVFVLNGDTFFDIDLEKMLLKKDSKIAIALKMMKDFNRYGCVDSDINGYITNFTEKQYQKQGNINGGVYLVKSNIFDDFKLDKNFSFEIFLQKNYKSLNATSVVFEDYFIDIGIPEDYERAKTQLNRQNIIVS